MEAYSLEPHDHDNAVIEMMDAIGCGFLRRIHPESWLVAKFTHDYRYHLVPKREMAAYVQMLMIPPAIDLGISYAPFRFSKDAELADCTYEVLAEIGHMYERFDIYFDGCDEIPQAWFDHTLDTTLAARFIPLIKSHDGQLLFHAPHFFTFLDYVGEHAEFAALLSLPYGPHSELFRASYDAPRGASPDASR